MLHVCAFSPALRVRDFSPFHPAHAQRVKKKRQRPGGWAAAATGIPEPGRTTSISPLAQRGKDILIPTTKDCEIKEIGQYQN